MRLQLIITASVLMSSERIYEGSDTKKSFVLNCKFVLFEKSVLCTFSSVYNTRSLYYDKCPKKNYYLKDVKLQRNQQAV